MKKSNLSVSTLVLLSVLASATARADISSQQVESSLTQLNGDYQQFRNYTPSNIADGGDILLACEQSVFLDWSRSYLSVVDDTPNLSSIATSDALLTFGKSYFQAADDLPIYEYGRPGITKAIAAELGAERKSLEIPDVDPGKMSTQEVESPLFLSNMEICTRPDFVSAVSSMAALDPSPSGFPPGTFSGDHWDVSWVASPKGGLDPVQVADTNNSPCSGSQCNGLAGPEDGNLAPVSDYQGFLNAVKAGKDIVHGY